jgi:hypothetical protein
METADLVIKALNDYFYMKAEVQTVTKCRKSLVYRSPSGVEVFRVDIACYGDGIWRFASVTHTLSNRTHQLEDVCIGEKSYA